MSLVIGIDFGTTNTVVAAMRNGRPEIVRTSEGLNYIPSVVSLDRKSLEICVGQKARNLMRSEPRDAIYSIKRLMGQLDHDRALRLGYRVMLTDGEGSDGGVHVLLGKRPYKPEDIAAMILRRAKEEAERYFNEEVRGAVLTVPAYAGINELEAIKKAAELAGLRVLAMPNESSTAALAVRFANPHPIHQVMVYRFGGATFDVSLLKADTGTYYVQGSEGDRWLGGDNFDDELTQLAAERIKAEHGYDAAADPDFRAGIKPLIEQAKLTLSDLPYALINAPNCCYIGGQPISVTGLKVTRQQYEALIKRYIDQSMGHVRQLLERENSSIDAVLLVGGATKTPCVRQAVESMFPGKVVQPRDPMTCVAAGAAIFSAQMPAQKATNESQVTSKMQIGTVTDRSFGTVVLRGHDEVYQVIIPKGTRLPMDRDVAMEARVEHSDHIRLPIYSGDEPQVSQNLYHGMIDADFAGRGESLKPGTVVTLRFRLSAANILTCTIQPSESAAMVVTLNTNDPPPQDVPKVGTAATTATLSVPKRIDENVQFTVFRPEVVAPATWYPLLAFAHLTRRRPNAPTNELDPIEEMHRQAEKTLAEQLVDYSQVTRDSDEGLPAEGEITFLPEIAGIEFNPLRAIFRWLEDVHCQDFRLRAEKELNNSVARGRLTVFLGSRIIADVPLTIRVDSQAQPQPRKTEIEAAQPYRKIFASYSSKDLSIVEDIERRATLGDKYMRDAVTLRAGEVWNDRLCELICEANIFQLFWSSNSMRSKYVRREWEYALSLNRPHFVRPVFWEVPRPKDEKEDLPPANLRMLHFQRIERPHTARSEAEVHSRPKEPPCSSSPCVIAPAKTKSRADPRILLCLVGFALVLLWVGWHFWRWLHQVN